MQVLAPAKINLSLKILGPRSDEFHEIETLIAPISLYDELKIERSTSKQGIGLRPWLVDRRGFETPQNSLD